jgi:hypothetical protein
MLCCTNASKSHVTMPAQATAMADGKSLSASPQLKDLVGKKMAATRSVCRQVLPPDAAHSVAI